MSPKTKSRSSLTSAIRVRTGCTRPVRMLASRSTRPRAMIYKVPTVSSKCANKSTSSGKKSLGKCKVA